MIWIQVAAAVFAVVIFGAFFLAWLKNIQKERSAPWRFELGEKVIRVPFFPADRYLVAKTSDYRRMTITGRRRTWIGRKVYTTDVPGVPYPVQFPEGEIMKNIA